MLWISAFLSLLEEHLIGTQTAQSELAAKEIKVCFKEKEECWRDISTCPRVQPKDLNLTDPTKALF
jgi:hypothetical protein